METRLLGELQILAVGSGEGRRCRCWIRSNSTSCDAPGDDGDGGDQPIWSVMVKVSSGDEDGQIPSGSGKEDELRLTERMPNSAKMSRRHMMLLTTMEMKLGPATAA